MSLGEIGLLESLFHGTSLLSEVPSGVLADRFSYKTNLYLSRLTAILSALFMLFGHGQFSMYALGMIIGAWSYNFDSGTASAFLFESVKETGLENRYLKFSSLLSGISEATRTLGMVLAAFFVHGFLEVTYEIQIGLSLIAIICIAFMKEPSIKIKNEEQTNIFTILTTVHELLKQKPKLFYRMVMTQNILTLISMFYFYYQNELISLTAWQISLLMIISSCTNILSVWLASQVGQKWASNQSLLVILLISALLFLLAITNLPIIYMVIFVLSDGLVAFFLPIFENDIQQEFTSEVRATLLSINAMLASLSMIIIFPLTGFLIDHIGFSLTFTSLGIVIILSILK